MVNTQEGSQKPKVLEYLKRLAPYSIVDKGIGLATGGSVVECSKSGNKISAIVTESEEENFSVTLDIISGKRVEAACRCSTAEEMEEQWCKHAIASLWRATDLGFFDPHSGFASNESIYRMNTSSPEEIAEIIYDVASHTVTPKPELTPTKHIPNVEIILVHPSDRLGVKVLFDGEIQEPYLFDTYGARSARALDNILLQILDEEGSWDEENKLWFVNSSSQIEIVLGLIQEYGVIQSALNGEQLEFPESPISAELEITWQDTGAQFVLHWILPEGEKIPKESELLGTGPYWVVLGHQMFRLSPSAARLASIFPYGSKITFARSQIGPILEAIQRVDVERFVHVVNPELQPTSEVKAPVPRLEISRRDTGSEHFTSHSELNLGAAVEFRYPEPPKKKNHVYLPNREIERKHTELLKSLGFVYVPEKRRYSLVGDAALDFVHSNGKLLSNEWEVDGLQAIRQSLRFSELQCNISLSTSEEDAESSGQGMNWFDCHISLTQNNANIPISSLFKSANPKSDRWIRLDSGAYAKVPGGGLSHLKTTLGLLDNNFRLSNNIKTRVNTAQAIGLGALGDDRFELSLDRRLSSLARKLQEFSSIERAKVTRGFSGKLRHYQEDGLSWLTFLHQFELGGILADEMGLGKTVQALALIQSLKDSRAKNKKLEGPVLIVAPTSVITNWMYEAKRFTPKLSVLLLHGPNRKSSFVDIPKHDVVITSYALLRLDRAELCQHTFDYAILDEAQNIKNPQAATTKAAKAISARRRLALTGTPTENRPLELWSIFDFLMPGYLGSAEFFRNNVERPILEQSETTAELSQFLQSKTRPFILRRLKRQVERDLPEKTESELHVEMTPSQASMYAQILEEVRPKVMEAVDQKGIRGASVSILAALLRLRQVCNHPNSIEAFKELPGYDSGKFDLLKDLVVEAVESGRKILLFSQFREMLSIIQNFLREKGVDYLYLDGATKNRQELIDRFNSDEDIRLFLISLKAGGTGLNLTAADTVIIYDPWWNPAVESQAVDRAHRIGQTKAVTVYRLVTENSIEQKIMQLKAKKAKIVDALINEDSVSPLKLTKTELYDLFRLDLPQTKATED